VGQNSGVWTHSYVSLFFANKSLGCLLSSSSKVYSTVAVKLTPKPSEKVLQKQSPDVANGSHVYRVPLCFQTRFPFPPHFTLCATARARPNPSNTQRRASAATWSARPRARHPRPDHGHPRVPDAHLLPLTPPPLSRSFLLRLRLRLPHLPITSPPRPPSQTICGFFLLRTNPFAQTTH